MLVGNKIEHLQILNLLRWAITGYLCTKGWVWLSLLKFEGEEGKKYDKQSNFLAHDLYWLMYSSLRYLNT